MTQPPAALLFLNDWRVDPIGANCGGGEIATISLAEALVGLGIRTIVCGNLSVPEGTYRGVEYWSFKEQYDLSSLQPRINEIGPFYAFAATLVHPFLFLRQSENCLSKILINHSPGIVSSGLEPRTVAHITDWHVCVSEAQKKLILMRGDVPDDNMLVIKNGYDPKQFSYHGPEQRDFYRLMFAGRLESPKGIHHLLTAYGTLKQEFKHLKLDIFGSQDHWPDLNNKLAELQKYDSDLLCHGKVNRATIAEYMKKAGLLVFPSISFETAGLVLLEAQGSGCPVLANNVGGSSEYIIEGCGALNWRLDEQGLIQSLRQLLQNTEQLKQMSLNCKTATQRYSWKNTAQELIQLAQKTAGNKTSAAKTNQVFNFVGPHSALKRTIEFHGVNAQQLLEDHELIANGNFIDDQQITQILETEPELSAAHLWQALRFDKLGQKEKACSHLLKAIEVGEKNDWQALFHLILLEAESGNSQSASQHTQQLLSLCPDFPLRNGLERLLTASK